MKNGVFTSLELAAILAEKYKRRLPSTEFCTATAVNANKSLSPVRPTTSLQFKTKRLRQNNILIMIKVIYIIKCKMLSSKTNF